MTQYTGITMLALCCFLTGCNSYPNRLQAKTISSSAFVKTTKSQQGQCLYAGSDDGYHYFVQWKSDVEVMLPLPISAYTTAYKVPRNQIASIDCEQPLHIPVESWRSCEYQLGPYGMVIKERWYYCPHDGPDNQTVNTFFLHRKMDVSVNGGRGTGVALVDRVTNISRAGSVAYHSSRTIPREASVYPVKVTQHLEAADIATKLDKTSQEASVLFYQSSQGEWKAEPDIDHLPYLHYR